MHWLNRYSEPIYAISRVIFGLMFSLHGAMKLFGLGGPPATQPLMRLAGVIELAGGLMIAIGLLVPIAGFICSGEMAFAYFTAHASHGWSPVQNKGELAVVYCFLFLYMAARGAGIWSADAIMRRPRVEAKLHNLRRAA